MYTLIKIAIIFLFLTSTASAQYGSQHPNGHWSYPGVQTNPAGITQHLLNDHRNELRQSLDGLTIDQQQTLHDMIHISRGGNYYVPYIAPYNQTKLREKSQAIKESKPVLANLDSVLLNL